MGGLALNREKEGGGPNESGFGLWGWLPADCRSAGLGFLFPLRAGGETVHFQEADGRG